MTPTATSAEKHTDNAHCKQRVDIPLIRNNGIVEKSYFNLRFQGEIEISGGIAGQHAGYLEFRSVRAFLGRSPHRHTITAGIHLD